MMIDDIRNHQPTPTPEESSWMEFDPVLFVLKLSAAAGLSIMVGLYAGLLNEPNLRTATTNESAR
jgi:hypothetical protein